MSDETISAWVKLFHPRGPQVTLPLPVDARAALDAVTAALDMGWLVQAPGLEEGEEKETVGYVLRSVLSNEGRETPFVLLYSNNDSLKWSFLKVYLNTDQDVAAFEHASRVRLSDLPEYVGQDKPQRGANPRVDKFIIPTRPFQVVFKKNPKHDGTEAGKMKPARLFVRWADTAPAAESPIKDPSPEEMDALDGLLVQYRKILKMAPDSANFHAWALRFFSWVMGDTCTTVPTALSRDQYNRAMSEMTRKIEEKGGQA